MADGMVHTFDNGIQVYKEHLIPEQLERYRIYNLHEPVEEGVFADILQADGASGTAFIDIGAAIGYYSILARQLQDNLIIHAFEPLERHRTYFEDNMRLNGIDSGNITIHADAISDAVGKQYFADYHYGSTLSKVKQVSMRSRFKRRVQHLLGLKTKKPALKQVNTITLDSFIDSLKQPVHLVKMDVQGFELDVLAGAEASLQSKAVHHWIVGTHSPEIHARCIQLFKQHKYHIIYDEQQVDHQPDGLVVARATIP
ncbi:MAG: FkbM family methyltransferase [Anaerolineae bacterium]